MGAIATPRPKFLAVGKLCENLQLWSENFRPKMQNLGLKVLFWGNWGSKVRSCRKFTKFAVRLLFNPSRPPTGRMRAISTTAVRAC